MSNPRVRQTKVILMSFNEFSFVFLPLSVCLLNNGHLLMGFPSFFFSLSVSLSTLF